MANASLGLLRVQTGKHDEARKSLERAVAAKFAKLSDSLLLRLRPEPRRHWRHGDGDGHGAGNRGDDAQQN